MRGYMRWLLSGVLAAFTFLVLPGLADYSAKASTHLNTIGIIETHHTGAFKAYGDRDITTHRSYKDHRDWDKTAALN